jgi:hypothetical protein
MSGEKGKKKKKKKKSFFLFCWRGRAEERKSIWTDDKINDVDQIDQSHFVVDIRSKQRRRTQVWKIGLWSEKQRRPRKARIDA